MINIPCSNKLLREEAARKGNRFRDSIFADPAKIETILENRPDFEISNLWEDYGNR